MEVEDFQKRIEAIYYEKDSARGVHGTFAWYVEEMGELSRALFRKKDRQNLEEEFGDCFAWLASLASLSGIDLAQAARKYDKGCPRCHATPCTCP
jgi:NTP pyrophosphatase (non-canonical NTP hydrolase)